MKILTEVWCVDPDATEKNKESGFNIHDEGNKWLSFGFEILDARCIKKHEEHEFLGKDSATVITFHNGDTAIVRMDFKNVWELWNKASELRDKAIHGPIPT